MLVLTRKRGESLKIGDDVVVKVQRIDHNRVRLAVDAPRHVRILRLPSAHERKHDGDSDRPRR